MNRWSFDRLCVYIACAVFIGVLFSAVNISHACAVPVFRYALERWECENYIVTVNPGKNPSDEVVRTCQMLDNLSSWENDDPANVILRQYKPDDEIKLSPGQMAVHFPYSARITKPILISEISEKTVTKVIDSPVRSEITKRLVGGDSAVWVFLESSDAAKNKAKFDLLKKGLKALEENLELPEDDLAPDSSMVISEENEAAAKISFSLLKLTRSNPDEKFLIDLLLDSESDLRQLDEPMVFPVFGRGIVLFCLPGDVINEENIIETCLFLTGACSCQVKSLNPGMDMLTKFNWDKTLADSLIVGEIELPELEGFGEIAMSEIVTSKDTDQSNEKTVEEPAKGTILPSVVVLLLILTVVVAAGTLLWSKRKQ